MLRGLRFVCMTAPVCVVCGCGQLASLRVTLAALAEVTRSELDCNGMAGKTTRKKRPPINDTLHNDVPTRVDLDTLDAWKRLLKRCKAGDTPTTRDLAQALGVSQSAAQWRLKHAHEKGLFLRKPLTVLGPYEISKEGERWLEMAS